MKYFIKCITEKNVNIDFDVLYETLIKEDEEYYNKLSPKDKLWQMSCMFGDNEETFLKDIFKVEIDESIEDNYGLLDVIANDFEVYLEKKLNIKD